jgi:hypothetical protein
MGLTLVEKIAARHADGLAREPWCAPEISFDSPAPCDDA